MLYFIENIKSVFSFKKNLSKENVPHRSYYIFFILNFALSQHINSHYSCDIG